MHPLLEVKVWGDFACFTRPEMKVERVSYDVMTPSAARGVLEAIFWKPEFRWHIHAIHVLTPIKKYSIQRFEVKSKIAVSTVRKWAKKKATGAYYADEDHTPRHTLALRDVAYLVKADVHINSHCTDDPAKYRDQFRRRVERGQYFHHPYFGCREFPAVFSEPDGSELAINVTEDLGRMFFDLRYSDPRRSDHVPIFFNAHLESGILHVPQDLYQQEPS